MSRAEDVLLLVGRLNYTWTNTESMLIYLMCHALGTAKEPAVVVFLTLNTTRARIELLERLAKMRSTPAESRMPILAITARLKRESRLRNKYNHCIYSFDETGEAGQTQLMRIAEYDDDLRYGKVEELDDAEMSRIRSTITEIASINKAIWEFLNVHGIPA